MTNEERDLLASYQEHAEAIAKLAMQLMKTGISVNFGVNPVEGKCNQFDVFRMVKVDMKEGAN